MSNNKTRADRPLDTLKKVARFVGIGLVAPFFIWLLLGVLPAVPSIIDVFGMSGLRVPTGIVIAGLMIAAFGFEDF